MPDPPQPHCQPRNQRRAPMGSRATDSRGSGISGMAVARWHRLNLVTVIQHWLLFDREIIMPEPKTFRRRAPAATSPRRSATIPATRRTSASFGNSISDCCSSSLSDWGTQASCVWLDSGHGEFRSIQSGSCFPHAQIVELRGRPAIRPPANTGLAAPAPRAAKPRQPYSHRGEQRRH